MAKFTSPAVTGLDIAACLRAFETDLGLKCRQHIVCHHEDHIDIHTTVYRQVEEVQIGICRETVVWSASDVPLLNKMLVSLHRMYHQADRMAHIPYGSKRNPNKG